MDRRDPMALSGSQSFYIQRGMSNSGSGGQGLRSSPNPNVAFQTNTSGNNVGSGLPMDPNPALSPYGGNVGAQSGGMMGSEPVKRKRGRPRKYGTEGTVSLALSPSPSAVNPAIVGSSPKRGRGRPPGSGKKQQLASLGEKLSGSAGMGFTPHVITIGVGEDIAAKITSFSQQGPRVVCILSANGAVSTVTLRQPSSSGGTVTYEGRFEIICLSGSYALGEAVGSRNRSGGLSVSLASPDGRVVGGGVGGALIAATPVQVIVGSFMWGGSKSKYKKREAIEGVIDSDQQAVDHAVAIANVQQNQNLTSTSSVSMWPSSQSLDMRNAHIDIDLMRG
ncbi:AT-hook motif nuclear-localized protein 9-like [Cucurbita maxima]|uniref:AT-hook motif nuclear-localized protein n=1 Tax=Cucurbita maxima TaxID=3661 RepID=A0A6J1KWB1_CUCMA|nr:AT-hook motif nuclear-localized protein 9-like [Cucurbita maxima]